MTADPALADWDLAARIAARVATSPLAGALGAGVARTDAAGVADLRRDLDATVRRADTLARRATGLGADLPPARAHVLGRRGWVRANLASLAHLTAPVADRLLRRTGLARGVAQRVMALQIGVVFGYLSTRVLGQYEVVRPPGEDAEGRLVLVGPNLLDTEAVLLADSGVSAEEFRLGVCLHEVAHRLQFEAVPWLRPRLEGLLATYLDEVEIDPDRVRTLAGRLAALLREPEKLREPRALLELVLTPRQAEIVGEAQALMSLLEGHGNVTMDWGAELADDGGPAVDPARVREVLNRRRGRALNRVVQQALGLSMKAEQYRSGEAFILAVAERHGREAFDLVWRQPANVPSEAELADPDAWVRRVRGDRGHEDRDPT